MQEEDENFALETPEDYFAYEEMIYPEISKCRKKGKKRRDKFVVPGKEDISREEQVNQVFYNEGDGNENSSDEESVNR